MSPGRWAFAPTDESRAFGKRIKQLVAKHWKAPSFYFHLRAGGHLAAVRRHASSSFFVHADIADFFGQVNRSRVTRCLKTWLSYKDARTMASESVVKRPGFEGFVLPYGFVQSPILASLALDRSKLGPYLRKLDGRSDLSLSLYVDDILISGHDEQELLRIASELEDVAGAAGFPLSAAKKQGPAPQVTTFNLELSRGSLRVTGRRLAQFRDAYRAASSNHSRAGILGYLQTVNPQQAYELTGDGDEDEHRSTSPFLIQK
ncbi:MAG: hypothetical protein KF823_00955 [Xanthomonadales bacterium]|nr:hypothetical protein [Xanthomonadales bacterium]